MENLIPGLLRDAAYMFMTLGYGGVYIRWKEILPYVIDKSMRYMLKKKHIIYYDQYKGRRIRLLSPTFSSLILQFPSKYQKQGETFEYNPKKECQADSRLPSAA